MKRIVDACEASMPRIKARRGRPPVYWWTSEIAELRRRCHRLRRAAQRSKDRSEASLRSAEYKSARKDLRRAINRSKAHCWGKLTEDVNKDPWGLGYKIVTQKLGSLGAASVMDPSTMDNIVRTLFPTHPARTEVDYGDVGDIPLFDTEELDKAARSLKNKKAPGPDGIPNEVLKIVACQSPNLLLSMYNACLTSGTFCSRWKIARLVLMSKGKGDPGLPSSYRPLCMLDTAGKLYEKLLKARLLTAVKAAGDLSPRQYGFRAGRSTVGAVQEVVEAVRRAEDHNYHSRRVVLLVTLDVKNAFNSAKWIDILNALENAFHVPKYLLRIISDYLRDRTLLYRTTGGPRKLAVTAGAAQGSILGPDLWNVVYDSLLTAEMPDETVLVGYADDVAALIAARDVERAQIKLNRVMRIVNGWMAEHGLSLALSKTEIVVLTKKRIDTLLPLRVGGETVVAKHAARYLGIMIDCRLNFGEHIRRTAEKAARCVTALSRLMANVGGPISSRRRLLVSVVHSILLYGGEVWAIAIDREVYRRPLARVQRTAALRVASAYRTVSEPAVLVIAGVIPIALLVKERVAIYHRRAEADKEMVRNEERSRTFCQWNASWDAEQRGRWTARLIRRVRPWTERLHGEVNYFLTQMLSGHGYFRAYLYKMGKVRSENCLYCPGVRDDAEHTFFRCDRWAQRRGSLEAEIGHRLTPDNIVDSMLNGADDWSRVTHYVESVLRSKKSDLDRAED